MGIYINPGNEMFRVDRKDTYIDKSGMISIINSTIDTKRKLTCISRARRFGKSIAAHMTCAYYDCSTNSSELFDDLEISRDASYREHMNKYNVIYLDVTGFISDIRSDGEDVGILPRKIKKALLAEVSSILSDESDSDLNEKLIRFAETTGKKIIFIIDERDAVIREARDDDIVQDEYLNLLRGWFKNGNFTSRAVAAAYMTGILPIKKDGSQSAISDFMEYTMLNPTPFEKYVGFTEPEVQEICNRFNISYDEMRHWYDGYSFAEGISVYNPNSVMQAAYNKSFESYWQMTSASDSLLEWLNRDYVGMSRRVAELMSGSRIPVNIKRFKNDMSSFRSADDVLTLLIHLGYLSYEAGSGTVCIPNEELRNEFADAIHEVALPETIKRVEASIKLINDTVNMNEEAVARQLEQIHMEECAPLLYNNEQSLRSVVKLAFFAYRDYYAKFEELPGGLGYADIVYLPKCDSSMPALIIELKWDESAETAISQIRNRRYPEVIQGLNIDILLVGISYDKDDPAKKHHCIIEKLHGAKLTSNQPINTFFPSNANP